MSFSVVLQTSSSPKNAITKSVNDLVTVTGVLKDGTSIINPTILIDGNISSYVNCNYMTISEFGRKYFVTDIKSIRNNLFEISGHCDVLSTYKNEILSNRAIIRRQQNNWNLYLNDGTFKIYQNPNVITKLFPSGFNSQEFVLAVAGS